MNRLLAVLQTVTKLKEQDFSCVGLMVQNSRIIMFRPDIERILLRFDEEIAMFNSMKP